MERIGNWLQTVSGVQYWPLDPQGAEVKIEDIAHSLGMQCRFGGHTRRFYSVAEHCIHVAGLVPLEHGLCGLLHDATEAYVVDVPRPVKLALTNYKEIETANWLVLAQKFNLPVEMPACVKHADEAMLIVEQRELMPAIATDMLGDLGGINPDTVRIRCWSPEVAAAQFLTCFRYYKERSADAPAH